MTTIKIKVANEIFLATAAVDLSLEQFIKRELTFPNPKRLELMRLGYSVWKVPKVISCYRKLKSGYYLPIGFGPKLWQYLTARGDQIELNDERVESEVEPIVSQIILKPEQQAVKDNVLKSNRAIVEAKPGFGKTMLAIDIIATRKQKTLIIVHTRALLQQWYKRICDYCQINPKEIGIIGEGKWHLGPRVTIASYQTLLSRGTKDISREFGLVVVDECHHVPANTFAKVVRGFAARYCLGLTATPFRKDRMDKLLLFYIGRIVPSTPITSSSQEDLLPESKVRTFVHYQPTNLFIEDCENKEFTEIGTLLAADEGRLQQVVDDVATAYQQGGKIIVLSERVGHAEAIYERLQNACPQAQQILVTGQIKKQDREQLLAEIKNNRYNIMVATGGVVGEGFDWPAADYLFLTFPFSWKGKLIQYVGRVQRTAPGKTQAHVYDYVDSNHSIFRAMKRKREAGYRELGVALDEENVH